MLGEKCWAMVESRFGPHSVDLMATDSNCMKVAGSPIRHYTPCPMPGSAGVNVFAQDISREVNPYCYPPFALIGSVLLYLKESGARRCTMVVPHMTPRPHWWPSLQAASRGSVALGAKGEKGVVWVPTKKGYVPDNSGLRWDLVAHRLVFKE